MCRQPRGSAGAGHTLTPQTTLQLPSSLLQVYLGLFCLGTVGCVSILGGTLAVLPAYEADLYGPRYVGPIHGRLLLATTAATMLGPGLLLSLRHQAHTSALTQLLQTVDPAAFSAKVKWCAQQLSILRNSWVAV